jgi:hypothetical protein
LHEESTAVKVLRETHAGIVLDFPGEAGVAGISRQFPDVFRPFQAFRADFDPKNVDMRAFDQYSARQVTQTLADLLDRLNTRS